MIPNAEYLGKGECRDTDGIYHDYAAAYNNSEETCDEFCRANNQLGGLRGFQFSPDHGLCGCFYDDNTSPADYLGYCPPRFYACAVQNTNDGPLASNGSSRFGWMCYQYNPFPVRYTTEGTGDPHCKYFFKVTCCFLGCTPSDIIHVPS